MARDNQEEPDLFWDRQMTQEADLGSLLPWRTGTSHLGLEPGPLEWG